MPPIFFLIVILTYNVDWCLPTPNQPNLVSQIIVSKFYRETVPGALAKQKGGNIDHWHDFFLWQTESPTPVWRSSLVEPMPAIFRGMVTDQPVLCPFFCSMSYVVQDMKDLHDLHLDGCVDAEVLQFQRALWMRSHLIWTHALFVWCGLGRFGARQFHKKNLSVQNFPLQCTLVQLIWMIDHLSLLQRLLCSIHRKERKRKWNLY